MLHRLPLLNPLDSKHFTKTVRLQGTRRYKPSEHLAYKLIYHKTKKKNKPTKTSLPNTSLA